MKMFKRSLALMFAVLLCCMTVFAVCANGEDNDVVDDWDGPVEEEIIVGDVNDDGRVNTSDLLDVSKYIVGNMSADEMACFEAGDVNNDDKVNTSDLLDISKYIVGALTEQEIADIGFPPKA